MSDWLSDLPGWAKGLIILTALGGSNTAQFLGFTAPAKKDFAAVESRESWCFAELKETQGKLEKCWQECSR